jgi:hypothetical protein
MSEARKCDLSLNSITWASKQTELINGDVIKERKYGYKLKLASSQKISSLAAVGTGCGVT